MALRRRASTSSAGSARCWQRCSPRQGQERDAPPHRPGHPQPLQPQPCRAQLARGGGPLRPLLPKVRVGNHAVPSALPTPRDVVPDQRDSAVSSMSALDDAGSSAAPTIIWNASLCK